MTAGTWNQQRSETNYASCSARKYYAFPLSLDAVPETPAMPNSIRHMRFTNNAASQHLLESDAGIACHPSHAAGDGTGWWDMEQHLDRDQLTADRMDSPQNRLLSRRAAPDRPSAPLLGTTPRNQNFRQDAQTCSCGL
jgi:hypothetical protein